MKKKIVLIVVLITLIIAGIIVCIYLKASEDSKKPKEVVVTNKIENYGYELLDTDTEYYKELFNKLKNVLDEDTVDDELYASLVSQLFITDFYTLNNKVSSSDIGGSIFVLESVRDNFKLKAKDTLYKTVKSNLYGDRDQELPVVSKVSIDNISVIKYDAAGITDTKAYSIKCSVTYDTDMGYPTVVKLTLVHNNNKIEIAKIN